MNGVSGVSGAIGVAGVTGDYIPDEKLEKVGLKLKNIFSNYNYPLVGMHYPLKNEVFTYNVCDKNGKTRVLTQKQYDNIYLNYIRKEKLKKLNDEK